jgi:alkanesulfonate monooxygenase SsuD/methylene tetrahydromethanopterin reductase-like flavin-dependent oxidoreductase (luciferase family)
MLDIQFGWFIPPLGIEETSYVPLAIWQQDKILPAVVRHFDSLWVPDHFYAFDDPTRPWLECWTALTWLAARFPDIRLGPIVLGVGYRSPALLAKMASSLQALSGGRFIMGIGGGWRGEEYRAYGYPFPKPSVRIAQLDEAVRILRLMWTEPAPSFKGEYFQIKAACCHPQPTPPPIMIGGTGEQLLIPLAARAADIWDAFHGGHQDTLDANKHRRRRDILSASAEALGRDPSAVKQSITIGEARLPNSSEQSSRWLDALRPLVDLGVSQFILDCGHVASPEPVERFAEEVILPLRGV